MEKKSRCVFRASSIAFYDGIAQKLESKLLVHFSLSPPDRSTGFFASPNGFQSTDAAREKAVFCLFACPSISVGRTKSRFFFFSSHNGGNFFPHASRNHITSHVRLSVWTKLDLGSREKTKTVWWWWKWRFFLSRDRERTLIRDVFAEAMKKKTV